jgi:hypothetical protein
MITAVALIVYNRPDLTTKSFAAIREVKPSKLFVIADGPKKQTATDEYHCMAARNVVAAVDWTCDVHRDYADSNLGLKRRVVSGLSQVFSAVDAAIIVEDDCILHRDFFFFAEELIQVYESAEQVWSITADNFQSGKRFGAYSYYFSKYSHCWGWATWRRAWQDFDPDITFWPRFKSSDAWLKLHPDQKEQRYWEQVFDLCYQGQVDSWAYPWMLNMWYQGGLTATPQLNFADNIGFGSVATHTRSGLSPSVMSKTPLRQILHPPSVQHSPRADTRVFGRIFQPTPSRRSRAQSCGGSDE